MPAPDPFTPEDLARITAETFIDRVDFHAELDSTNTRAAELATSASPLDRSTLLVLADRQTAGRGRGANRWWSADGALTFTILLRPDAEQLPTRHWPLLSLIAGLAVARASESLDQNLSAQIKWPNDVYLAGRKVAGILVEAATGQRGVVIVGIGVNVNNSAVDAPPELRDQMISLCDAANNHFRRAEVLAAILRELAAGLAELTGDCADFAQQMGTVPLAHSLLDELNRRSFLTGRTIELHLPTGRLTGRCQGIDTDGVLLVDTPTGTERILSGTITRFAR